MLSPRPRPQQVEPRGCVQHHSLDRVDGVAAGARVGVVSLQGQAGGSQNPSCEPSCRPHEASNASRTLQSQARIPGIN